MRLDTLEPPNILYQSPEEVLEKIEVTQHAKERYAERIMEKDSALDIKRYVLQNEEKIKTDLAKMVFYGEIVYTGKQLAESPENRK